MATTKLTSKNGNPIADCDFDDADADELNAAGSSDVDWLWDGYLAAGRVTLLTSQWKCGKTTLVATLLARMGAGGTLAGRAVRAGRVLVVSEEDRKLWAARGRQLGIGPHARYICRPFRGRRPTLERWRALVERLCERQRELGLDLVVIDALASFMPGTENDAGTVLHMLLALQDLTDLGVGVLILHHPRKGTVAAGQAARGSGALGGNADIVVEMDGLSGPTDDDRRRKLAGFSRFAQTPRRLVIEWTADGSDYTALGDFNAPELDHGYQVLFGVLEDASGKLTRREILSNWPADYRKPDEVTLFRWLERAVRDGQVLRQGSGSKGKPFKYWLDGMEEVWESDPFYVEPAPPVEFGGPRITRAEVLAKRKAVSDGKSQQKARGPRRPRRAAPSERQSMGNDRPDSEVSPADMPVVADPVPGPVGVPLRPAGAGPVRGDPAARGPDAGGAPSVAGRGSAQASGAAGPAFPKRAVGTEPPGLNAGPIWAATSTSSNDRGIARKPRGAAGPLRVPRPAVFRPRVGARLGQESDVGPPLGIAMPPLFRGSNIELVLMAVSVALVTWSALPLPILLPVVGTLWLLGRALRKADQQSRLTPGLSKAPYAGNSSRGTLL